MGSSKDTPVSLEEGPELLGALFAVALWGITCVQTLFYFINFPDDKLCLKAMVAWLWLSDSMHQLLLVKGVYGQLITNFCNYQQVLRVRVEYLWQVMLTTLVALPSQFFFVNRIAKFGGKRWLPFALWVPAATLELAGGSTFIGLGIAAPTTLELVYLTPSVVIFTTAQVTAAVVDLSITAGLIFLLWKSREDAQYKMRPVIQRLLILSLSTGVWTALFAILTVITMLVFPNTLIYGGLYFPLCPIYCNTVLANLNARQVMKNLERRSAAHGSIPLWQETESSGPTALSGQSHGLDHGPHELAQTPGCQCLSADHRRIVEAGVQASSSSIKVEQFA